MDDSAKRTQAPIHLDDGIGLDYELGEKVHALIGSRMVPGIGLDQLGKLIQELYDLSASKRIGLVRSGHIEDATRFDNEHFFRAYTMVWQPLERFSLEQVEKDAIERALAASRSRWLSEALKRINAQNYYCTAVAESELEANRTNATRRAEVDAYIEEVFSRTGKRITRTDIWKSARYKSRTEFERWERNDQSHPNKTAHQRFTRILTEKPHLK
jgi:hypothetical protein